MKIAFISPQIPPGGQNGIGVATLHLALGLCELGNTVDIYTWLDDPSTPIFSSPGLNIIRLPNYQLVNLFEYILGRLIYKTIKFLTFNKVLVSTVSLRNIRGAITMNIFSMDKILYQYDIVESCEWGGVSSIFSKVFNNTIKITKLHFSLYSHSHTYFPYITFSKKDVEIATKYEINGTNNSNIIISPSKFAAEEGKKWLKIEQKISIIPNSINLNYFDKFSTQFSKIKHDDIITILFVGRVDEIKGINVIEKIVQKLRSETGKWQINIVGSSSVNKLEYPNLFSKNKANVDINWIGELQNESVYKYLFQANIFLFPSLTENCPMVVLEAMAARLPVVASCTGGIPEIIESGVDGILCPVSDAVAFTTAILNLNNPILRYSMGENARTKIESVFSSIIVGKNWLNLCLEKIITSESHFKA